MRLPGDAKAFIEAEARENASSQNSEIIRAIRERMKAKEAATGAKFGRQAPAAAEDTPTSQEKSEC
jgi:hypothetical protein